MPRDVRVVLVDYALAPEHPFPAGLHDALHVYDAVRAEPSGLPILVGGDSAGGGLATSLVVAALAVDMPLPSGVTLFSPWLDLTVTADSYDTRRPIRLALLGGERDGGGRSLPPGLGPP